MAGNSNEFLAFRQVLQAQETAPRKAAYSEGGPIRYIRKSGIEEVFPMPSRPQWSGVRLRDKTLLWISRPLSDLRAELGLPDEGREEQEVGEGQVRRQKTARLESDLEAARDSLRLAKLRVDELEKHRAELEERAQVAETELGKVRAKLQKVLAEQAKNGVSVVETAELEGALSAAEGSASEAPSLSVSRASVRRLWRAVDEEERGAAYVFLAWIFVMLGLVGVAVI